MMKLTLLLLTIISGAMVTANDYERPVPIVMMHGLGDSADSWAMREVKHAVKEAAGIETYVTSVAIGDTRKKDEDNGIFMEFDQQTLIFAAQVMANELLSEGFNAIGFSQGNLIIRAYIERFNDPPVKNFLSIHGPLMGVATLPKIPIIDDCHRYNVFKYRFQCKLMNAAARGYNSISGGLSLAASSIAYTNAVQKRLGPASYYRNTHRIGAFRKHARFLPDINNERREKHGLLGAFRNHDVSPNTSYRTNFASLELLVLVKAIADTMIDPRESQWFGAYKDGSHRKVLPMRQTKLYQTDAFGLKSLDDTGRIIFLETNGQHLEFELETLKGWVKKYLVRSFKEP